MPAAATALYPVGSRSPAAVAPARRASCGAYGCDVRPATRGAVDAQIEIARWRAVVVAALALSSLLLALSALLGAPGGEPLAASGGAAPPAELVAGSAYVVQPGDTLWSIARRLSPGDDPRPVVDELAAVTGGSVLVPGQAIMLPSP